MAWDNDNPQPLYVTEGDRLEPEARSGTEYAFRFVEFNGIDFMQYPKGVNPDSEADLLKFFPANANRVVCFSRLGDALSFNSGMISPMAEQQLLLGLSDWNGAKVVLDSTATDHACGFLTDRGTIIPQFICPWNLSENILFLSGAAASTDAATVKRYTEAQARGAFCWEAQQIVFTQQMQEDTPPARVNAAGNVGTYGRSSQLATKYGESSIITIPGVNTNLFPEDTDFHLIYDAVLPATGALAFLADFAAEQESGEEEDEEEEEEEEEEGGEETDETKEERIPAPPAVTIAFGNSDTGTGGQAVIRDYIEVRIPRSGEAAVRINAKNSATGSIDYPANGLKTPHATGMVGERALNFIYALFNDMSLTGGIVTNPAQPSNSISCLKDPDLDIGKAADPKLNRFPQEYREGRATYLRVGRAGGYPRFGNACRVDWTNCWGNFGIALLRFSPVLKFSYFYWRQGREAGLNGMAVEGVGRQDTRTVVEEWTLAIGGDLASYTGYEQPRRAHEVWYNAEADRTLMRVDFEISRRGGPFALMLHPIEIHGMICVYHRSGRLTDTRNDDGNFSAGFKKNLDVRLPDYTDGGHELNSGNSWLHYITNIRVSHDLSGTSGSITLDKGMMMDIGAIPEQALGALTLRAHNGFYLSNGDTTRAGGSYSYHGHSGYPNLPWGQFFRGYVTEVSTSANDGSGTVDLKLEGINRKLEDMMWINAPYWDGDYAFGEVLDYIVSYTGCDLRYVDDFSAGTYAGGKYITNRRDFILPSGANWEAPAVHFAQGTSCMDSIREIAKYLNHQFIIQPDGRGYFYGNGKYGLPVWVEHGPVVMEFDESDLESFQINPILTNRYNSILTIGNVGSWQKAANGSFPLPPVADQPAGFFTELPQSSDHYPWARIKVLRPPGVLERREIRERHQIDLAVANADVHAGEATIPGFHALYLLDKVRIRTSAGGKVFYITGIGHTLSIGTKEWKTNLTLTRYKV